MSIDKKFFPFFENNKTVWLDNAATTQKPAILIETEKELYSTINANIHRGLYGPSEAITTAYEEARQTITQWINCKSNELFFTSGTTAALNQIATYWGLHLLKPGDEILISIAEHHANFLPWQRIAQITGSALKIIPYDVTTQKLDLSTIEITSKTKIIALAHHSNVLGPLWSKDELERLIQQAHKVGAFVVLDVAQSVAHKRFDAQELAVDAAVFSAHKMAGPTGIGGLYLNQKWHDQLPPLNVGGGMVANATIEKSSWLSAPAKFEAGTPAIVQAISWAKALQFLHEQITQESKEELQKLMLHLIQSLEAIPGLTIVGDKEKLIHEGSLVSFTVKNIHAHDLAAFLAHQNIAVRAGHHCAQPLHDAHNLVSSLRVSLFYYNTQEDIDLFLQCLHQALTFLSPGA